VKNQPINKQAIIKFLITN